MTSDDAMRTRMTHDLEALGVQRGGVLLMHSSLSSLGWVLGGPEAVITALLDALSPDGTLLLPALSHETVTQQHPVFDVSNTPSCVGRIAEYFRTRPGTLRSVNPTHSVCATGRLAREITSDHQLDDTPVGEHSPFRKVRDTGGQVLFLGCGLRPNTSMHGVEELVQPPYLFDGKVAYRVILQDGSEITLCNKRHGFAGYAQRYDRLGPLLSPSSELREGKVLQAMCYLLDAQALWARALARYTEDNLYFVDRTGPV